MTPARHRSADYRTLNFVLSSNVIVFFYSFWMMVADAFRMSGRCAPCGRAPPAQPGASRAPARGAGGRAPRCRAPWCRRWC